MAKCFDVTGYIEPCGVVHQKYTGRALLITGYSSSGGILCSYSNDGLSIDELNTIGNFSGESGFVKTWVKNGGKAVPVMIDAQNPFGVNVKGNTDSGRVSYTKTIPVTIPATRDVNEEAFIMGLQKGLHGCAILVLESFGLDDQNGINENDIFGIYSPVRLDPTSVTRNEYDNGGAWSFNLVCEEPFPNVISNISGLRTALDELNV